MRNITKEIALEVVGRKKKKNKKKWWTPQCEQIVAERRHYRLLAEQDKEAWENKYKEVKLETRKYIKRAKRDHMDGMLQEVQMLLNANKVRKFYQEIRTLRKGYQPSTQMLLDDNGNMITDTKLIKNKWQEYFQNLLNSTPLDEPAIEIAHCNMEYVAPPSIQETYKAISRLKNNKSPGIDGIPAEIWKYSGSAAKSKIHDLLLKIWETEHQPDEWNMAIICPIHKKGCKKKCTNYRGIALLPTAYKIMSYVLLSRLEPYAEKILGDYQCGFRRNRSTIDQIFLLKQLMEKKWEYAQSIHAIFVDFTKAYDSIDRGTLYAILRAFDIPNKLVNMIKVATSASNMRVKIGGELMDSFAVITGLKQGDAMSPVLFNLVLEYVVRKILTLDVGAKLFNKRYKIIGYADDLALLGENRYEVQQSAKILEEEAKKVGLTISHEKTEYLHIRRYKNSRARCEDLHVGDKVYKGVHKFKYLGCTVTDQNTRGDEIDIRIQNTLKCSAALHKVLVSRLLSRSTKMRTYKTIIRPILMYGCEAWTLTLKEENKLLVAERKVLRKILGPVRSEDGTWRIRKNLELEDLLTHANIIGEIKAHRLRWLGHLERMGEDRKVKEAYLDRPTGRRPVGRPRYRWSDSVEGDLRKLRVSNWREVAEDRDRWKALISEAKTHFGSLSQRS